MGTSRRKLVSALNGAISPSEDKTIDTLKAAKFYSSQYQINLQSDDLTKNKTFIVSVTMRNGTSYEQVYNKSGDSISVMVQSNVSGPNIELKIKNNEIYNLTYRVVRTKF